MITAWSGGCQAGGIRTATRSFSAVAEGLVIEVVIKQPDLVVNEHVFTHSHLISSQVEVLTRYC